MHIKVLLSVYICPVLSVLIVLAYIYPAITQQGLNVLLTQHNAVFDIGSETLPTLLV